MKASIREKYVLELTEEEGAVIYEALLDLRDNRIKDTDAWSVIANMLDDLPIDWPNY